MDRRNDPSPDDILTQDDLIELFRFERHRAPRKAIQYLRDRRGLRMLRLGKEYVARRRDVNEFIQRQAEAAGA